MTDQITVPRETWDAMREALNNWLELDSSDIDRKLLIRDTKDALTAANTVSEQGERDPLDLGQYINDAHISASDFPVAVIKKLQAVINERTAHHG